MNDRHPSGDPIPPDTGSGFSYPSYDAAHEQAAYGAYGEQGAPYGHPAAYDGYSTGTFDNLAFSYGEPHSDSYGNGDPLFGSLPGADTTGGGTAYDPAYDAGHPPPEPGHYATSTGTGTSPWTDAGWAASPGIPAQPGPEQADYGYPAPAPGQWDTGTFDTGIFDATAFGAQPGSYDYDTGQWDASQWETAQWDTGQWRTGADGEPTGSPAHDPAYAPGTGDGYGGETYAVHDLHQTQPEAQSPAYDASGGYGQDHFDPHALDVQQYGHAAYDAGTGASPEAGAGADFPESAPERTAALPLVETLDSFEPLDDLAGLDTGAGSGAGEVAADAAAPQAVRLPAQGGRGAGGGRSRRRAAPKARRSALLTVAVPSVAVMGVAGVAAASVIGASPDSADDTAQAADDAAPVKPSKANSKLDTQLAGLSEDSADFADRANRTQERLDLKKRQEEERKRKAEEAARKEAMRPKFALPVEQHGLSAQYGQAGVNWMSIHTGIDFPVSYGTPVMAATDGTVSTKWDVAYGNMAVVTAADGTETWYCHLSSTKIRSGEVKAGDVIGYSGNSGNSTGPHLHFEVRPGGGSAVDPLPWLRSHGLDPT